MTTLVVGATGATGQQLVGQLLKMGQDVKVIVRPSGNYPKSWEDNHKITFIKGEISKISVDEMVEHLKGCQAVASCLGHNITLKGMFGKPRKLVTDAVALLCESMKQSSPSTPFKLVLMNTTGNQNRDLTEPISGGQKLLMGIIRTLLPPQADNEKAADHLRLNIGQNNKTIEWVAVRPDSLINENQVSEYSDHPSPIRSALFDPGKTSRINVGNFMARLIVEEELWVKWKGQMPVIYNTEH